jgi:hypothetical protein
MCLLYIHGIIYPLIAIVAIPSNKYSHWKYNCSFSLSPSQLYHAHFWNLANVLRPDLVKYIVVIYILVQIEVNTVARINFWRQRLTLIGVSGEAHIYTELSPISACPFYFNKYLYNLLQKAYYRFILLMLGFT